MGSNEAILKTLLYADIFDYPLKQDEVWKFLISDKKVSKTFLFKNTKNIEKLIEFKNGYFFIKGRKRLINLRKKREKESIEKISKVIAIINKVSFVPSVKFIGISGALSMKNSDSNDDIDLFVITEKDFAWTTRLILVLILIFSGNYRNKKTKEISDKICLNMLLDKSNMSFKKDKQNLYTAHEIAQLIPVLNKDNTYEEFILKNSWIKKYLANLPVFEKGNQGKTGNSFGTLLVNILKIIFLEDILRFIQIKYMEKSITKEIIERGFLAFHPFDYSAYILEAYSKKIKKYKI